VRRAAALLLIVGTVIGLQRYWPTPSGESSVALALGFALVAAYLLGGAAERLRLPRLSGYLVFGLVCGPYMLNLITATMARELQVVNGVALAMIALVAGLEMNLPHLRRQARAVLAVGGLTMVGTMAVLTAVLYVAWPSLPLPAIQSGVARLAVSIVTAALVTSFSPTVSIAVIAESRARGPLTELVMASVIFADLLLIVVFALALQLARWSMATGGEEASIGVLMAWQMGGSLAFGAVVGALFAFYLRLVGRELTIALLGVCVLLAFVAPRYDFELILSALAAGLVMENIAPPEGDALRQAIERGALPLLIVFFAAAGASLQLDALAALGVAALGLALIRVVCIRGVAEIGVRMCHLSTSPGRMAWMGLVSQAGVTLGLATIVASEFPDWGGAVRALVVALTALHVLTGPILFKAALQRAGEIGQF
jgi:Kef-type K+ transport system membrane component KefB